MRILLLNHYSILQSRSINDRIPKEGIGSERFGIRVSYGQYATDDEQAYILDETLQALCQNLFSQAIQQSPAEMVDDDMEAQIRPGLLLDWSEYERKKIIAVKLRKDNYSFHEIFVLKPLAPDLLLFDSRQKYALLAHWDGSGDIIWGSNSHYKLRGRWPYPIDRPTYVGPLKPVDVYLFECLLKNVSATGEPLS